MNNFDHFALRVCYCIREKRVSSYLLIKQGEKKI